MYDINLALKMSIINDDKSNVNDLIDLQYIINDQTLKENNNL